VGPAKQQYDGIWWAGSKDLNHLILVLILIFSLRVLCLNNISYLHTSTIIHSVNCKKFIIVMPCRYVCIYQICQNVPDLYSNPVTLPHSSALLLLNDYHIFPSHTRPENILLTNDPLLPQFPTLPCLCLSFLLLFLPFRR
jgi:hypothetical protein